MPFDLCDLMAAHKLKSWIKEFLSPDAFSRTALREIHIKMSGAEPLLGYEDKLGPDMYSADWNPWKNFEEVNQFVRGATPWETLWHCFDDKSHHNGERDGNWDIYTIWLNDNRVSLQWTLEHYEESMWLEFRDSVAMSLDIDPFTEDESCDMDESSDESDLIDEDEDEDDNEDD
jgi:hypothetical protein